MSRREFLDTLGRRLRQELSQDEVRVHIQYYEQYLNEKISQGISEEDAVAQLGDPLLIAKTIMDVRESSTEQTQDAYERQDEKKSTGYGSGRHHLEMNSRGSCLIMVLIGVLILAAVFWVLKSAISFLMPVIAPVVVVMLVISLIKIWKK